MLLFFGAWDLKLILIFLEVFYGPKNKKFKKKRNRSLLS
jgi:hypothetical protein